MKRALLGLFFVLGILSLSAQPGTSIDVSAPCLGGATFNFVYDATESPDASGRNVYFYSGTGLEIQFNTGANRWEIRARGGSFDVYYINTFASAPNPPDHVTSAWDDFGFCDMTGAPTVTGTGTQDNLGTDPCDGLGGDTDGDGVCDDNDACPGFDDNADMDNDNIPDGCDANPNTPDGVLLDAPCLDPTDPIILLPAGTDATGRNIYDNDTYDIEVRYNAGLGRWEVKAQSPGTDVYFYNTFASHPNPPALGTGSWVGGSICNGDTPDGVSGSGTQTILGCTINISNIVTADADCNGGGSITVTVTGAKGTVTYSISGPVNASNGTGSFTGLTAGMYTITVSDGAFPAGVCEDTDSRTLALLPDSEDPTASDPTTTNVTCPDDVPAADPAVVIDEADNCGTPTVVLQNEVDNGTSIVRTYRVSDASSNFIDVFHTINITGGTPATITNLSLNQPTYCPGEGITLTVTGSLNDADEWVVYTGSCGGTEVTTSASSVINLGSLATLGTTTIYVRGEGACVEDPGVCTQIDIVVEVGPPNITCPGPFSPAIVNENCVNATADYTGLATVSSACGAPEVITVTQYPSPGTLYGPGVYPITLTAVGESGNVNSCTFNLTVQDATDPTATSTLTGIDVACMDDFPDPDPELVTDEADNCGSCPEAVWVNEFHYENVISDVNESVEVAGTAGTDLSNYSLLFYSGANGMLYMTVPLSGVIDDESNGFGAVSFPIAGILNGPMDGFALVKNDVPVKVLEFLSYEGVLLALDGAAEGMQSTDIGVAESGSAATNVSLQRTGTGNYAAAFTWTGPAVSSPGDLNTGQTLTPCGGVTVTFDSDADNGGTGAAGDPLIVTRTYLVTDAAGNSIQVTQTITLEDSEAPQIVCPDNITVDTDPGECNAVVTYTTPVGTDNCSGATTLPINGFGSGATFFVGTTTETYEVTDAKGGTASCSFTITVEDNEAPEVDCKDFSADLDINGEWEITAAYVIANAFNSRTDNCGLTNGVNVDGPVNYTCDHLGANSLTIYSLDVNGNETPCEVTLTINDPLGVCNQPPVAVCQNIEVAVDANCEASITAEQIDNGSNDPDNDPLSLTLDNYGPFNPGIYMVELTVSDGSLMDKCTATVTVVDNIPPSIICPPNIEVSNGAGNCTAVVSYIAPTGTDNCPGSTTALTAGLGSGATFPVGVSTETYEVTDAAGLTAECSFTVTVNDTEDPTAICKTTTVQLGADGTATLQPTDINDGSFDNCNQISFGVSLDQFDCTDVGPQQVTLTVTDLAGNSSDCSIEITVVGIVSIDGVAVTDESCDGAADGQVEITATGTGTLEYSIDGGQTFQDESVFTALADDTYDIVVRDKTYTDCEATGSATVAAGPVCELKATDPCVCLNNASPFNMDTNTGGGDGQFSELVTISAEDPLPAGLIFRVIAPTTGVYDVYNVPAEGVQSAGVPVATDGSVTFTYNNGVYELPFVHNDGEGYTLTVILEVEGVNSIGFQLSNTCFYPEPVITSDLTGPFCALSNPVTLEGNAGGVAGTGAFYIDGNPIAVFDPSLYAPGTYTISYEFDAGAALGYILENLIVLGPPDGAATIEEAEADPGCISTVIKSVEIIPVPEGYACKEQVNVSLQENCQATLLPENLIGDLECVDLDQQFEILVEDGIPGNGAVVDGCGRYRYILRDPEGVECWGYVLAEDKQPPTLAECPDDIRGITKDYGFQPFVCDDIDHLLFKSPVSYTSDKDGNINYAAIPAAVKKILDITGYAKFIDNCGDLTITVTDQVVYGYDPDCDDVKIVRTFTAIDACQKLPALSVCTQEIYFTKPSLEDVYCPDDVELSCDENFKVDGNGNPHPDVTGYPWVYTAFDLTDDKIENYRSYLDPTFCNLGASYTDGARIEVCASGYKLVRTWEILDWCTKEVYTCQQIIKIGDTEAPEVSCEEVDYDNDGKADLPSYSTGPYDCTAAFQAPMPVVTDNCSEWEVLTEIIGTSTGGPVLATIQPGGNRYVSGIPLGCHFIRYTVTDDCGNKEVIYCPFVVEDRVAPVAICDDDLNVSIGGQGLARVYASDIDEGSSDNCGPIRIEVRRRVLPGADYGCLEAFDYDGDGKVIGDELNLSVQFGDPDGTGVGQEYYYTPWADYVDFTCCDMGLEVRVELRVWDDRNGDGLAGNTITRNFCDESSREVKDNSNVCWMDLLVEDKLPAYCTPPLPAYIDCDKLPYDFDPANSEQMTELFGAATGTDNCPGYTIEELAPLTDDLNDCGYGTFVRRFQVSDAKGQTSTNKCEQIVTIKEQHYYKIKFPKDAEAVCGDPMPDTVTVEELACDLLAVSVKDDFFSASGDECYKIFRTYSVINWCEYDGQSDPVVVSRDEDCDGKPGDEDIWVIVKTRDKPDPCYDYYGDVQAPYYSHVWYDRDNDPFNLLPKAGAKGYNCEYETNPFGFWKEVVPITENEDPKKDTDNYPKGYYGDHCDDMASVGYWQYTQVIKVYDNIDPIITWNELEPFCSYSSEFDNDCPVEVTIPFTIDENCTPEDLTITLYLDAGQDGVLDDHTLTYTGTYPNFNVTGTFPLGAHYLGVSVEDGCGNQAGVKIPFEVVDCKAPTPICINGLAIELMPVIPTADADGDGDLDRGAMAIWASDFIASLSYDCTGEVKYSINRVGEEVDADQTGITLTCDDDASLLVEIWAWDGAGNGDFCETYVLVQDNMVNCTGSNTGGSIAGIIADEELSTLAGVDVGLSGNSVQSMLTPADGHYAFMDLGYSFDYTVTPYLDKNPLNGVSTFDLVLMSKHILGLQSLGSPYKIIAADVNNSKTITTLDAIQLRRMVLNIDTKFSNNTSWRFVPRDYAFPDPTRPWEPAFPEVININNLQGALENEDFVAVKIGDLNSNAKTNALETQQRSIAGRFALQVEEAGLKAGESYRIDFRARDLDRIQGYQMTLQLDPAVSVSDLIYGLEQEANFGTRYLADGYLTTSWNKRGDGLEQYQGDEILFSLVLEAHTDVALSKVLQVSHRLTVAEAYGPDDELLDVALEFGGEVATAAGFEVYQNVPNPFSHSTSIGFSLPEDGEVSIRIYDISGRTVKLIRSDFARGRNQVNLSREELGASGMLYYTVTSGEHSATKKMMVIE